MFFKIEKIVKQLLYITFTEAQRVVSNDTENNNFSVSYADLQGKQTICLLEW